MSNDELQAQLRQGRRVQWKWDIQNEKANLLCEKLVLTEISLRKIEAVIRSEFGQVRSHLCFFLETQE